jgi:hypothetical protein
MDKLDQIDIIENEIAYAKSCLQPHDTGHINTAIAWMQSRITAIKEEIREDASLYLKRY